MVNWKLLHYQSLSEFNKQYYKDIIQDRHLKETEKNFSTLKFPDGGEKENFWGFIFEKDNKQFLLPSQYDDGSNVDLQNVLPLQPTATQKVSWKEDVYHLILGWETISIEPEKVLSLRQCVDRLTCFQHSRPADQTLFTLCSLAQYFSRSNIRYSTPPGFGKDSLVIILDHLLGRANNIVKPTMPKLEMLAQTSKLLAVHEVVDVPGNEWRDIEQFLLDSGALKPRVTKASRSYKGSGEFINIEDLSLSLCYNDIDCYPEDADYFDKVAKEAVKDRFLPVRFSGKIEQDFSPIYQTDTEELVSENLDWYEGLLKTLLFFQENMDDLYFELGYDIGSNVDSQRWRTNMATVLKLVALYAKDEEEFMSLKSDLLDAVKEYDSMIEYDYKKDTVDEERLSDIQTIDKFSDRVAIIKQGIETKGGGIGQYVE